MGLPIMGNNECIKSGVNFTRFHDDSGCIGIVGGNSIICNVRIHCSALLIIIIFTI